MSDASTLDFDRAEPTAGAADGLRCGACGQPIFDAYWQVNEKVACEKCRNLVARERATRRPGRFLLAGLYGTLTAAAGAGLYYAVRAATGYEFGLIAIVVGLGVGMAVRKGGQGRGGWAYQALAMFLTYMAIVSTYVPLIVKSIVERDQHEVAATAPGAPGAGRAPAPGPATPARPAAATAPADEPSGAATDPSADASEPPSFGSLVFAVLAVFGLAMALPFLAGLENLMGLAIIGFGLYEAWKINKAQPLTVSGPFDAKTAAGGGAAAVG